MKSVGFWLLMTVFAGAIVLAVLLAGVEMMGENMWT